jgi:cytidylate kinase
VFRIVTVEREFGCGAPAIAADLARSLGWKLWDQELTQEIAKVANVDCSEVERHEEKVDSRLYRIARVFWRGSYERATPLSEAQAFDADCMLRMMQEIMERIAQEGNAVIVGRGAPYLLRERSDSFHVFMYAPRPEKIRRVMAGGKSAKEAEELVDSIDRERMAYVKHYFDAEWPNRTLYHLMINTAIGNQNVLDCMLRTMRLLNEHVPPATVTPLR